MIIKELNRSGAKTIFDQFVANNGILDSIFDELKNDADYFKIRQDILSMIPNSIGYGYEFDLKFGLALYQYFNEDTFPDFNDVVASNYDFWRFLCLKVVPDVVMKRHGLVATYFYEKNVRIYLSTLWWYIHMSYQGTIEQTYECLKNFSTDYVLQFVERPGRDGMYLEIARTMIKYLSKLSSKVLNKGDKNQTLLRRLLVQHTARSGNYNLVIEGKADQYVKELFLTCGVTIE